MRALADALRERDTRRALEADFRQYYGLNIKGIWTGELHYLEAARLLTALPHESRLYRVASKQTLSFNERLLAAIIDATRMGAYYSMIGAQVDVDRKAWGKVVKGQPEPIFAEKKPKEVKTVHARDIKTTINQMIAHKKMEAMRSAL